VRRRVTASKRVVAFATGQHAGRRLETAGALTC
jgi:hypothetical protein